MLRGEKSWTCSMSKIGERCLRTRARERPPIVACDQHRAPCGASARAASRQTVERVEHVLDRLHAADERERLVGEDAGAERLGPDRVATIAGAAASGASDGSKPTVSSNPAACSRSRNAPSPAPMSTAPRRSGSCGAIVSTTFAYVAAAYRASSPLAYPASDTRRSATRRWARGSRRGGRTTHTRVGGGRAPRGPSSTRTTSSRGSDCSKRASTNTRASVDPQTGQGRPPCSNVDHRLARRARAPRATCPLRGDVVGEELGLRTEP